MDNAKIKGNWNEIKGKIKQRWSKLTDDDLMNVEGHVDELVGKLEKTYGYSKDVARKEFENFKSNLGSQFNSNDAASRDAEIEPMVPPQHEVEQPEARSKKVG